MPEEPTQYEYRAENYSDPRLLQDDLDKLAPLGWEPLHYRVLDVEEIDSTRAVMHCVIYRRVRPSSES